MSKEHQITTNQQRAHWVIGGFVLLPKTFIAFKNSSGAQQDREGEIGLDNTEDSRWIGLISFWALCPGHF